MHFRYYFGVEHFFPFSPPFGRVFDKFQSSLRVIIRFSYKRMVDFIKNEMPNPNTANVNAR